MFMRSGYHGRYSQSLGMEANNVSAKSTDLSFRFAEMPKPIFEIEDTIYKEYLLIPPTKSGIIGLLVFLMDMVMEGHHPSL